MKQARKQALERETGDKEPWSETAETCLSLVLAGILSFQGEAAYFKLNALDGCICLPGGDVRTRKLYIRIWFIRPHTQGNEYFRTLDGGWRSLTHTQTHTHTHIRAHSLTYVHTHACRDCCKQKLTSSHNYKSEKGREREKQLTVEQNNFNSKPTYSLSGAFSFILLSLSGEGFYSFVMDDRRILSTNWLIGYW